MPLGRFAAYFCALTAVCVIAFPQTCSLAGSSSLATGGLTSGWDYRMATNGIDPGVLQSQHAQWLLIRSKYIAQHRLELASREKRAGGFGERPAIARRQASIILAHTSADFTTPYETE